jgi:type IX secretion system PorP/SprF family membrane protein
MTNLVTRFFTLLFFVALSFASEGQQFPLYTQYMFNPYLVNPSVLAPTRQSEVNILYRQQWTGIQDGPKTLQFDFQHAFNNQVAIGFNINSEESILLSNFSAMATFGYKIPLASDHSLGFGMSAGILSNRLKVEDIPDIDANDPVIQNYTNKTVFNSAFGFNYSYKKFIVGFSLLRLFDNNISYLDSENNLTFSQLRDQIIFAGYTFNVSENFSLQPNFSYRFTLDNLNFFETSAFLSYRNMIGLGGGYREGFGPIAIARVYFKDLEIGFAYDFPSPDPAVSLGGTNEFQLKWKFGKTLEKPSKKKRSTDAKAPVENMIIPPVEEQTEVEIHLPPISEQPILPQPDSISPDSIPPDSIPVEEVKVDEFIFVIGSFRIKANAEKYVIDLAKLGYKAELYQTSQSNYIYVHLPEFRTTNISLEKLLEIRKSSPFKDAWFRKRE